MDQAFEASLAYTKRTIFEQEGLWLSDEEANHLLSLDWDHEVTAYIAQLKKQREM